MVTIRELFSAEVPNFPSNVAALQRDSKIAQLAEAYAFDGRNFALADVRHGGIGSTSSRQGAKVPHLGPSLDVAMTLEEIEARCQAARTAREEAHERIRIALLQRRGLRHRSAGGGRGTSDCQGVATPDASHQQHDHLQQQSNAFSPEETLDLDVPLQPSEISSCSRPTFSRSSGPSSISPKQRQLQVQTHSVAEEQRASSTTPSTVASTRPNTRQGAHTPRPGSRAASALDSSRPASCTPIPPGGDEFVPAVFPFPEPIPTEAPARPPPRKTPPWSRLSAGEPAPLDEPGSASRLSARQSPGGRPRDSAGGGSDSTLTKEPTTPPGPGSLSSPAGGRSAGHSAGHSASHSRRASADFSPRGGKRDSGGSLSPYSRYESGRGPSELASSRRRSSSARQANTTSVFLPKRDSIVSRPDSVRRLSSLTEPPQPERLVRHYDPLDDDASNATARQLQDAYDNRERANRWISECAPKRWLLEQEKPPWLQKTRRERAERRQRDELLGNMRKMPFEVWLAGQRRGGHCGTPGASKASLVNCARSNSVAEQDSESAGEEHSVGTHLDPNTLASLRNYFQQIQAGDKSPTEDRKTLRSIKTFVAVDS